MAYGAKPKPKFLPNALTRLTPVFLALLVLTLGATIAFGQTSAINGSIRGQVTDPSGAPVPAAGVTVRNTDTGFTRKVASGTGGYYVIPNLPVGTYTVTIAKAGFTSLTVPDVVLHAGTEAVINGPLKIGAVSTTVTVSGGTPILQPSSVFVGSTISQNVVSNLPLNSRNPYNFIVLQPGISGHPNPELGVPRTLNTNGQLDRIQFQIDGMTDTQANVYGLRAYPISNSYVREVQTITDSFAPQFGNTSGDTYNVISNSGTNQIHGLFHWISRPNSTTARPMLLAPSRPKPSLSSTDYVVNTGGPVIRNKLFYFGSYEHFRRGGPAGGGGPITITTADAQAIGLPASQLATPPAVEHAQFADVRLDWNINSKNSAFLRLNYFRNEYPYNSGVGGLNALDNAYDFHDRAYILAAQITSTISPTLLNRFSFSWGYRHEYHAPGPETGHGPSIRIEGVAYFNGITGKVDAFDEKQPTFYDDFTAIHGAHTFKMGFQINHVLDNTESFTSDTYTFSSIADYLAAKNGTNPYSYTSYSTLFGNTNFGYHSLFFGMFVQDTWQVKPTFTLIYGLRYDKYLPPPAEANAPYIDSRSYNSPSGDIAPRVGFSWEATPKTVVRASFGKFYDQPPTNIWFNPISNDGSGTHAVSETFTPSSPGAPAFPNLAHTPPSSLPTQSITSLSPKRKDPYALTTTLQISRQLTTNDSFTIGYQLTEGHQLLWEYNSNLINPIGQLADGRPIFSTTASAATRRDPQFNNITMVASGSNSNYNALLLEYEHRFASGLEVRANYTWSHSLTDAPNVAAFEQNAPVEDPTNRNRDYGNALVNRPDAFNISSVYTSHFSGIGNPVLRHLANGNTIGLIAVAQSGDQANITSRTAPLNGDTITTGVTRPVFVGRNSYRGPKIVEFDTRYTRNLFTWHDRITPQFIFSVTNLFNDHHNITFFNTAVPVNSAGYPLLPNNSVGLPSSFPGVATVLEPRTLNFGLAVRW